MLETLNNCPICQNSTFENHLLCKDHMITQESFHIQKCTQCGFLFTNPRPDKNHIGAYYKSDQYISHSDKSNNLTNTLYKFARVFTLNQKLKLITKLVEEKSILDFGCGTGDFLSTCKKNNWEIQGFEPDHDAKLIAQKKTKVPILESFEKVNSLSQISIVTLWHVLEHISALNETLDTLTKVIAKEGKLLIAVPNHESLDAKKYQAYWAAYDVPRHLYHFSKNTMAALLKKHGLKIIHILPMKLDSFYVSLLSEKYQKGSTNLINSFVNGCKSNIYANKNQKNYSSLIYVAGK